MLTAIVLIGTELMLVTAIALFFSTFSSPFLSALLTAGMSRLGFGYLVVGSVMPRPRPGNPRPRMLRRDADQAIAGLLHDVIEDTAWTADALLAE